ncbi:hypothetical protein G8S49_11610 [Clostridium botulinum C]|uniref:CBM6 domain-containing protein n=3 Tax=Clostridium botulinum TaxID=1491 RepID=A0A9N7AVT0_CLOBO|nr:MULTISPECIES: hypothetical protein [Clostridium]KMJ93044.1 hypothetical protein CBCST_p3CbCSt0008 [Clostridium botulinum C str. Stockholm]ACT33719.1 hypothetical protein CLG_A0009 [Clostridium botulinum D str. 1873]AYF55417.1 hypothetical protein DFH04_11870 [Clostridium novyi]MBO3441355.1 hypothetical protein [Clostridium haemolyticum]MCD3195800.1 hypothetical protein [Clostridium botulinum C]
MDIQSDKYILGQSISKIISNQDDEIRLDLSLQPNTRQLLLGPEYDSFTIASLGYIPPIRTNATKGRLNSVTIVLNGQFVQGLGTSYSSEVNLIIYTMVAGQYDLNIKYLSGDKNTTLLINIAGVPTGVTYNFPKTTNWEVSSARTLTVSLDLPKGRSLIKFYNNYRIASPWIGDLEFSFHQRPVVVEIQSRTCNIVKPAFQLDNGYVGAIGDKGGYVVCTINVSKAGIYTLGIQYLSGDQTHYINRILKLDVNGVSTGKTYTFPNTGNWEVSSARVFNVVISLNKGENTVKFYNSPNSPGPWIGLLTFTEVFFYKTIEAENTTLTGTAKINDELVSGIGYGLGSITFDTNSLPCKANYDLIIRYISTIPGRTARLLVNGVQVGGEYVFETTDDWQIFKYKTITIPLNSDGNIIKIS